MKSCLQNIFAMLRASPLLVLIFCLTVKPSARAANDYWAGVPDTSTTTNWTDAANWTSAVQTYYNQVEFLGVGASANTSFAVNNVLDGTTGVAQMPIWELDYAPTNGNYTTLIVPGVTMSIAAGNGTLRVGADQLNGGSPAPANAVETITITGPGAALTMAGTLFVGQGSPTAGDTHNVTLDLSGLDNFSDSGSEILVASGGAQRTHGTLYLAKTNYITLGNDIQICNQTYSNSVACGVYLGENNYILTGTGNLVVGGTGTTAAGAFMKFNPAFLGGANPPTAYIGGSASDNRIVNFYICNANGTPQVPGSALCDFSGGNMTLNARTMQLGQAGNAGVNALGVLTMDDGVVNVNNATVGNQGVSSGGTGVGIINLNTNVALGASAALQVNSTLTLAAVSGTVTAGSAGTINVNGGSLTAENIVSGGGASGLNLTNASFTLSGTAGAIPAPISSVSLVNSTLSLAVIAAKTNIEVASLSTGGPTNIINITVVPPAPAYPVRIPLIKYQGSIGGAGFNFGVGTLPSLCAGYIFNNTADASVDLVLTSGPFTLTWSGSVNGNWDTTTANWLAGSTPTSYADGSFVQFVDGASTGAVNLTAVLSPGGVTVSNNVLSYTFNGSGNLSGGTALLKQGAGTLILDNTGGNNFSGGITISGGVLQLGNGDTSGNLPAGAIVNNGVLGFDRTDNITINNVISGSGGLVQAGGDTLQLSGANTFANEVVVTNDSVLQLGGSSALGAGSSNVVIASSSTFDANGYSATKPIVVSGTGTTGNGAIINSGGAIYDNPGPGLATNITLAGDTTFTMNSPNRWDLGSSSGGSVIGSLGAYNLTLNGNGGYFEWRNLSVQSVSNIIVASGTLGVVGTTTFGNPNGTLVLTPSGALQFYGANVVVQKMVDFQNGTTIYNSSGANTIGGPMTLEAGYCTFDVGSGTSLSITNALTGTGVFYQTTDAGTTILSGNSPSFTGGVLLYNGQLTLNGLIGSGITSQSGTTVAGSGTAEGLVDVSGLLLPGGTGVAGTFTASGLTLESSATVTMNLSSQNAVGGGANALVAVNGDLTVNGNNILINPIKGFLANGTYTLFTYTGNLNGTFGTASTIAPSRYTFTLNTSTPGKVNLVVSGQGDVLEWNNAANNGQWDVATSINWRNLTTHSNDVFLIPDTVVLDDSIITAPFSTTSITIPSGQIVVPNIVTNNSTTNYSISGPGKISGGASIIKSGSSTLTISNVNDFTGGITVAGGTLNLNGATSAAGATNSPLVVSNGATLALALSGSYPAGDAGFGNKPLVVSGSGANGQGAIQISGGSLYNDSSTLGLGQSVTLTGNATFSGTVRWDWGYPGLGSTLSTGGSNYNFTAIQTGYSQWQDLAIDPNLGNFDFYQTSTSQQTWNVRAMGTSLGNPTNVLTLHSNVLLNIVHGDTAAGDNGYAKIVHILPTAAWQYQPGGGAGDYRLNTSFVLENGAGLYFFSGNGGNGSGIAISGTVTLNGLAHFQIGNSPITFSNVISGPGGFYMDNYSGNPPLVFAATNTYQGITDIRSGLILSLMGNGSILSSTNISLASSAVLAVTNRADGTLTLASGQTLTGGGIVNGILVSSAGSTVLPGTSSAVGTLTVSNNTTLNGSALFKLNGTNNDVLNVGAALTYGGTLTLINITATPLAAGNTFKLFNAGSYTGAFSSIVTQPPLAAGLSWNTDSLISNGTISVVSVTTSQPHFTHISISGTTLNLSATNGTAFGQYVLLGTTNLTLPLNQWTPVLTNSFDENGNLNLSTNIINPNNGKEFYLLSQ